MYVIIIKLLIKCENKYVNQIMPVGGVHNAK